MPLCQSPYTCCDSLWKRGCVFALAIQEPQKFSGKQGQILNHGTKRKKESKLFNRDVLEKKTYSISNT